MSEQKFYCYKVKHSYIKIREDNAYVHAKIEKFGFEPMFVSDENGDENRYWAEGWAKTIRLKHNSGIGMWIKKNIEQIYAAENKRIAEEKEKKGEPVESKWVNEILEGGYEFDEDGMLIDNEESTKDVEAQLCIMATGDMKGVLFINVGGAMEIYNSDTLLKDASEEVLNLITLGVVYKKRLKL